MGGAKEMMMEAQEAQSIGLGIAARAGVVEICPIHELCYWATYEDPAEAYRIAAAKVRDGDEDVEGYDRQTIMDGVKAAIDEAGIDECSHCASNNKD